MPSELLPSKNLFSQWDLCEENFAKGAGNFATCINLNGSSDKNSSKRQELYRNVGNTKNKIINTTLSQRNSKVEQVNCRKKQNITSDEVNIRNASDEVKREATISDADKDNETDDATDIDEDEEIPNYLMKEKPHHNWHVVQALAKRQIGNSPLFQRRFYGSLSAVERFNRMCNLNEHQMRYVNALSFNRKGNLLASVADDLEVVIWDWNAGKKRDFLISGHIKNMFYAKWLPLDVEYLMVTCAADGQVRLLDLDCKISIKLMEHHGAAQKLAVHPQTPYLIFSVGDDGRMLSIDTRSHDSNELLVNEGPLTIPLTSIQFNPLNCNEFCVSGWSSYVRVYDCRNVSLPVYKLCPDHLTEIKKLVTCAAYNYNGTEILATYHDEDIYLFDRLMSSPVNAHRYQGHRNTKYANKGVIFFGPKSEYVISGSDCGNLFTWDKNTEALLHCRRSCNEFINCLEGHPDTPILATAGLGSNIEIWMPSRRKPPTVKLFTKCMQYTAWDRMQRRHGSI